MRDAVDMWREPKMVVLVGVCAAVYAAAMIPFKFLQVFPGLAEVRPATVFPIVFSFLFGPAGAWGAAFGNLVGDMLGGMLGPGSIFGFFANFVYGYLPYKLWEAWMAGHDVSDLKSWSERLPGFIASPKKALFPALGFFVLAGAALYAVHAAGLHDVGSVLKWKKGGELVHAGLAVNLLVLSATATLGAASVLLLAVSPLRLVAVILVACLGCAGLLGWGVELLGFFPFKVFAPWILANNFALSFLLAPPLLMLLYPRVAGRYMLYTDIMAEQKGGVRPGLGSVLVTVSLVGLFAAGVFIGPDQVVTILGSASNVAKGLLLFPFVSLLFVGLILL